VKTIGGLAQLARALALQARGHRFESDILHSGITKLPLRKCLIATLTLVIVDIRSLKY
jgi:hypothetical protein